MDIKTRILIIGGGPAGATAAKFLAKNGQEVILLEKNPDFVKPCGGGLSINAFNEFDIPQHIIKKTAGSIRLVSPSGEQVEIDLQSSKLAIVERREFDKLIRLQAAESGAEIVHAEFRDITGNNRYRVTAGGDGILYNIEAEYIIASDGVNSKVRTALGIKPSRAFFTISEHIDELQTDACEFWFGSAHAPLSYSWVFPSGKGISVGTGSFTQGTVHTFFNRFVQRAGLDKQGTKKVYRIPVWTGDLYNVDKILFAGDAAGQVLPLTYEGIYYAMKSAEFAAQAIIENKAGNYKKKWKARFQKRFMLMSALRDYFLKDDASAERLVSIHKRPEIQEASLRLWITKDHKNKSLMSYISLFRKLLR